MQVSDNRLLSADFSVGAGGGVFGVVQISLIFQLANDELDQGPAVFCVGIDTPPHQPLFWPQSGDVQAREIAAFGTK